MSNISSTIGANRDHLLSSGSSRPFGSVFTAQNPLYLMYLPLLLLSSGLGIWLLPSSVTFFLGSVLGSAVAAYIFWDIVFRTAPLRFSVLLAMALLIGYCVGSLNSWLTVPRAGLTLAEYFARDPVALARAVGACLGAAGLLLAIGELYERPIFGEDFRLDFDSRAVTLIVLSTLLVVTGYATGQLGYQGITPDAGGHINPLAAIILWWSVPAFAYSVCASLNTTGGIRLLVIFCTVLQGLATVPIGRRNIVYALVLATIATRLGRYRSRMRLGKKLLWATVGAGLVFVASIGFLYLRVSSYGHKGTFTTRDRFAMAADLVEKRSPLEVAEMLRANASTRSFDIGFFSDLLDASLHSDPLFGVDLVQNLLSTIPSAISANKFGVGQYGEESLADMHWGFSYLDEANTLVTAGALDFGIIGVLVYPLLAVLLLRSAVEWFQFNLPPYGSAIIGLAFIQQMLMTEQSPSDSVIQVRNAVIFAILVYLVSILPKIHLRADLTDNELRKLPGSPS